MIAAGVVLSIGLGVAVPLTYSFIMRVQAKSHIAKGCKAMNSNPSDNSARAHFSKAALLDPAYLPLAAASVASVVDRQTAQRFGYEQQWLNGLSTIQGVCDNFLNPQSLED